MPNPEKRFEIIYYQFKIPGFGRLDFSGGSVEILLDRETGVQYLVFGYKTITPLLDSSGKPVVSALRK